MTKLLSDENLHGLARAAVDAMNRMAASTKTHITDFHERQLVFEMGSKLRDGALTFGSDLWTAYEYGYPRDDGKFSSQKCDIVGWLRPDQGGPHYAWLEAKSTGLDERGKWDNAFSQLGWKHDLEKLQHVLSLGEVWGGSHQAGWCWLYVFPTYRAEVRKAWGILSSWRGPEKLSKIASKLGPRASKRVTLPSVLFEIEAKMPRARASIAPRLRAFTSTEPGPTDLDASALVVTAVVDPA